ncbi:MAG: hypothetical protein A2Z34_04765, partial [Planctomycetes bacterium RBG_16_59_8]
KRNPTVLFIGLNEKKLEYFALYWGEMLMYNPADFTWSDGGKKMNGVGEQVDRPFCLGGYAGTVRPEFHDELIAWLKAPPAGEVVKENRARFVRLVRDWHEPVYIKKFKVDSFLQQMRLMFLESRAEKESKALLALKRLGIPAPDPIAAFIADDGSYLVTRKVDGVIPLKEYLMKREGGEKEHRPLLNALADYLRDLSAKGVCHRDFHIGNILIPEDGTPRFTLVDLQRTTLKERLSEEERESMTAFLALSLSEILRLPRMVSFLIRALDIPGRGGRERLRAILRRMTTMREKYYRGRELRSLKEGSGFTLVREKGRTIHARRDADIDLARTALTIHLQGGNRFIKTLPHRRLTLYAGKAFVKEFRRPSPVMWFLRLLGREEGRRMWVMHQALRMRGLKSPDCWMLVETPSSSTVVGEWIPDALPLNDFLKANWRSWGRERQGEFIERFSSLLRRMYRRGIYHRDLKANNILIGGAGEGETIRLLDLESLRHLHFDGMGSVLPTIIHNLAQLNGAVTPPVTRGDRLRFLRALCGNDPLSARNRRRIIGEIMKATIVRRHLWPSA